MPWPTNCRTTEYPFASACDWTAQPMSPRRLPGEQRRSPGPATRGSPSSGPGRRADLADRDGPGGVAAPAVLEGTEINGQNVALLEHDVAARDAVDDHLVDRRAEHRRVAVVAEERRLPLEVLEPLRRRCRSAPRWSAPGLAAASSVSSTSATIRFASRSLAISAGLLSWIDIAFSSAGRPRRCGRRSGPCSRSRRCDAPATWPARSSRAPGASWRRIRGGGCG